MATAVPAFVGYTEFASDNSKPLHLKPFRVSSLAEYERYFGGAPPSLFDIGVAGNHLAVQNSLIQKIQNNVTTTGNVFAVWFTVFVLPWETVVILPGLGTISRIVGVVAFALGVLAVIE